MIDSRLLRVQKMAERFNKTGTVSDESVAEINHLVETARLSERVKASHNVLFATPMTGERIRSIRERNGISQGDLAAVMNMSANSVQKWERGVGEPSGPALKILALIDKKGIAAVI